MTNDNPVLAAVIAGVSSIIVGILSLYSSKKEAPSPSKREIYIAQLNCVWEPLDKLLSFTGFTDPSNALQCISTLISENYKLIPNELLTAFSSIKQKQKLTKSDFRIITEISASYFHWTKRYLGYPYDRKKIKIEYSPRSATDIFLFSLGNVLLLLLFTIGGFALVFSVMLLVVNDRLSLSEQIMLCMTLIGVISTMAMVFNQPRK